MNFRDHYERVVEQSMQQMHRAVKRAIASERYRERLFRWHEVLVSRTTREDRLFIRVWWSGEGLRAYELLGPWRYAVVKNAVLLEKSRDDLIMFLNGRDEL